MKIELMEPYASDWRSGYLTNHPNGRKYLCLFNSRKDRTVTQYARYLLSVSMGRYLKNTETVDHIDDDPTNDNLDNLQLLSLADNIRKEHSRRGGRRLFDIRCPQCGKIFTCYRNSTMLSKKIAAIKFCSRRCSGIFYGGLKNISSEEKAKIFKDSVVREYSLFF